jgi:hypothetical protein
VVALFLDGVVVAQQTVIVALGITRDGRKEPLGLRLGSTENGVVCTELLQDLLARGLPLDGRQRRPRVNALMVQPLGPRGVRLMVERGADSAKRPARWCQYRMRPAGSVSGRSDRCFSSLRS